MIISNYGDRLKSILLNKAVGTTRDLGGGQKNWYHTYISKDTILYIYSISVISNTHRAMGLY